MQDQVITLFTFNLIKVLLMSAISAFLAFLISSSVINFLNRIKFWKRIAREKTITGESAKIVYSLHKDREVGVPRGGGIIIWLTVFFIIMFFWIISFFDFPWWLKRMNFLSRNETWLPLFTLISASLIGLLDDALVVFSDKIKELYKKFISKKEYIGGGLPFSFRLALVFLIGLVGGLWFYYKLGWDSIHIPLLFNFPYGIDVFVGPLIIVIFIIVMIASWAGGVIDGLDGLAGGVFASIFGAFTVISFSLGKIELAAFCASILGSLFAFLWFNVPPARSYMGETGVLALTSVMSVIAFLTDSVVVLPIIAAPLVLEVLSVIIQLISKRLRGKKVWLATPIHHHFEAKGMPAYQIVMRFWLFGVVCAVLGTAIRLLS
jgi:phospho-N-acetylmuramoyl-pentapeptide-transferase